MKPLNISPAVIAREAGTLAACFLVAFGANVYAVIHFRRPAVELLSQFGFVVAITAALFAYVVLLRLIWSGLCLLWRHVRTTFRSKTR